MSARAQTAAFFDLDGTLLPSPSLEWRFLLYLLDQDQISSAALRGWVSRFKQKILRDRRGAIEENKVYLAGLPESRLEDWAETLDSSALPFFAEGLRELERHQAQGHRMFLMSGTLAPLARVAAAQLPGRVEVCATELDSVAGRWTGFVSGEHRSGEAKVRAMRQIAARVGMSLGDSFAYGNDFSDLAMLESVGFPCAVNPSRGLRRAGRRRGWPIFSWSGVSGIARSWDAGLASTGKA